MLFTFLLVVHAIIAAALVTVILMQRSEGGGLGMGSGPSGLMTARGAADFLTRATSVLATLFVLMAFLLAALASMRNGAGDIDTSLAHQAPVGPINAPVTPTSAIPLAGATTAPVAPDPATAQALAPASAGLPPKPGAVAPTEAPTLRPIPSVSHLKTIDTHTGPATVGIEGLSSKSGGPPATNLSAPATIKAPEVKAPDARPATTPAAATPSTSGPAGNSQ